MNLSYYGIVGKWYHWNYNHYTNNLCTLFWGSLWALLWLPVTIFSIWASEAEGLLFRVMVGMGCISVIGFLGFVVVQSYQHPLTALAVFVVLGGAIALIIGAVAGLSYIDNSCEITDVIREKKKSFKDKYCPVINWK